ncbi:MAG: diguanylate cyclase [Candidatus Obscuribacterales bacterium]|nr:diguanylate cyclase [Candidatus Obscuribacterales bacterium]
MAEPGRTQLQMMLVKQSGREALPLSGLVPDGENGFLPFLRTVEQLCVDERLAPVVVYWSSQSAARLLPGGQRYRELMRDAFRVSIFSEDVSDGSDDWCFLIESRGLSLIIYGQKSGDSAEPDKYQCAGSMDPRIVSEAFNQLLGIWQQVNQQEANLLEDARANMGAAGSFPQYIQQIKQAWPIVKAPSPQTPIYQPTSTYGDEAYEREVAQLFAIHEHGKVSPIAVDPTSADFGKYSGAAAGSNSSAGAIATSGSIGSSSGGSGSAYVPVPTPNFHANPILASQESATLAPAIAQMPSRLDATSENVAYDSAAEAVALGIGRTASSRELIDGASIANELEVVSSVFPPAAQLIIREIIGQLRHSNDLASILQFAIEALTKATKADRGLIWQVVGDQLQVTNEYAVSGHTCFAGNQLGSDETVAIVFEFLKVFKDDSGAGVIPISDTTKGTNLHKSSPTLSSLMELGDVRARLLVQLRTRGLFSGFLELQQCGKPRDWSENTDAVILQHVAEMLSVVVQQSLDRNKIEMDAREMKLINEIATLFRESRGQTSQESLVKSVMMVAEHMSFTHSQIYLYNSEEGVLVPQIQDGNNSQVDLTNKENPFVSVFESGRGKIVNVQYSRKGDSFFGHDVALVLPLVSEGERLGVIGLWQRLPNRPEFRPADRDLGLTIAGHLSNVIRADQAISQIRADRSRAALINRVSSEIRQSLKDVDQFMQTLGTALQEHFGLALCATAVYDVQKEDFTKFKTAGDGAYAATLAAADDAAELPNFGEKIFQATMTELKDGQTLYLPYDDLKKRLEGANIDVPTHYKQATLVPLIHGGELKAALCMISSTRVTPLPDKDMKMVADLADRVAIVVSHAELFAQVEQQAVTDPMTGLFNRRYFQEQFIKEIDRFQRFGHAFSFIIVDLDYLKKINDGLGHHFGDMAIKHIANVMKKSVRDVDTVGRFGGEEFVILLPETDLQHARMVAERICMAIREKPIDDIGVITASLGVATFPYDAQDRDKLQELADQALYLAKHRGRNQVCTVAEDLLPSIRDGLDPNPAKEKPPVAPLKLAQLEGVIDLAIVAEEGILGVFGKIMKAIEERDSYGSERSPRAYSYANGVAQSLHLSKEHAEIISLAAVMSNLGKIAVTQEILQKEGQLSDEELEQVKQVPAIGAKLLEPAKLLYRVANVIESYRENWDGSGYPKGLKGDDIPLESRIIALVDGYTAMTSDRPYRKSLSREEAIRQLQQSSGKRYDPRLVKIFMALLAKEDK